MFVVTVAAALVSAVGAATLLWVILRVRARREIQERKAQLLSVVNAVPDGVMVTNARNEIEFVSSTLLAMSGYSASELIGKRVEELVPTRAREQHVQLAAAFLERPHVRLMGEAQEIGLQKKDGCEIPVEICLSPVRVRGVTHVVAIVRDVTQQRALEEKLKRLAFYDTLTSLPNRVHFQHRLQLNLKAAKNRGFGIAVLFIDLDGFKQINDSRGHEAGDFVLRTVAGRMVASLRPNDDVSRVTIGDDTQSSVSRLGGDEFIALLSGTRGSKDVAAIAERLATRLAEPIVIGDQEVRVGASIGIALYPDDGSDAETLVVRADAAMYQAKAAGGRRYRFFSADIDSEMTRRRKIGQRLEAAISAGALRIHYQPLKNAKTGAITGAEALLRWSDEELGAVSASELIAAAEGSDLIFRLDEWVLRAVCRQVRAWRDADFHVPPVSVNVSPRRLRERGFAIDVAQALAAERLSPADIQLEVTETAVLDQGHDTHANLAELRKLGVGVVLDDFGTGFSSLTHLARLPITGLKIDREFVASALENERAAAVVSCLSVLARRLGLTITAEGVESEQQQRFLLENGCEEHQGFLFSPAVEADVFSGWLVRERREVA